MIRLYEGQVYFDAGDILPLECSRCRELIPFTFKEIIMCLACGYTGKLADFWVEWRLDPPN